MFGLENQKKKKEEEFFFELEKELQDQTFFNKTKSRVEERIMLIKNRLRGGQGKEEFDKLGQLLHGYSSLVKVINRVKGKK